MDTSSEIYDNSYAEIMQHSLVQDTISRHTISVGTPTITADRFWTGRISNTEDYITGLNTRYYSQSDKPKLVTKPLDEIKLDLLDDIRTVKNKRELYMLLSKSMRELQF